MIVETLVLWKVITGLAGIAAMTGLAMFAVPMIREAVHQREENLDLDDAVAVLDAQNDLIEKHTALVENPETGKVEEKVSEIPAAEMAEATESATTTWYNLDIKYDPSMPAIAARYEGRYLVTSREFEALKNDQHFMMLIHGYGDKAFYLRTMAECLEVPYSEMLKRLLPNEFTPLQVRTIKQLSARRLADNALQKVAPPLVVVEPDIVPAMAAAA